jgi:hypothetical protein
MRRAALGESSLIAMFDYWDGLRARDLLPARAAVDPLDIPRTLLPNVALTEVRAEAGRRRYRYRVVGSRIVEEAGCDPSWRFLDEVLPAAQGYRDFILSLYDAVAGWRAPVYSHNCYVTHDPTRPPKSRTHRLLLPLADDDGAVSHVLGAQVFANDRGTGQKPFLAADSYSVGRIAFVTAA